MDEESQIATELRNRLLRILDEAMRVDEAACGKIRLVDPQSGALKIEAQRGFSDGFVQTYGVITDADELASARAARLRRRVSVPDVAHDPQSKPLTEIAQKEGFKAMQATPILGSDGRLLGTLSTHFPKVHQTSIAAGLVLDYCADKAASIIERIQSLG